MSRWMKFGLALLLGLTTGLVYGWLVNPVEFVQTTPVSLSEDYRTDYVLMTAEVYASTLDCDAAIRSLAFLSSQSPIITTTQALEYAQANRYAQADIALLEYLLKALWDWEAEGFL